MSGGATGTTYMSVGTVRVRSDVVKCEINVECKCKSIKTVLFTPSIKTVLFTPSRNFSVSRSGRDYVALLPAESDSGCGTIPTCGISVPYKPNEGIRLILEGCLEGLVEAAIKQCVVEIEVKDCKDKGLELRSITIPAAEQTK